METRVYLVDEMFWKSMASDGTTSPGVLAEVAYNDEQVARQMEEFLQFMEVPFPKGAYITLGRAEGKVTLRNLPKHLDKLEKLMGPMKGNGVFYKKRIQ